MRIVGGRHRGRRIEAPPGLDIRPTADRAREAAFNLIERGRAARETGFVLAGARVLDAFCGTGAMGLEALSRGAAAATFLDADARAVDCARTNAALLGESARAVLLIADATKPPPATAAHDLVLLDPPYASDLGLPALEALAARGWIAAGALIVLEHRAGRDALAPPPGFALLESRRYGKAAITLLRYAPTLH